MKLKKNIAVSETGFIFDSTTGDSYSLNTVGAEIINMLKANKQKEEIKASIFKKYEVDDVTFEKSYYDFINMLKQFNLVE